jgi:hypothetical protein
MRVLGFTLVLLVNLVASIAFASLFVSKSTAKPLQSKAQQVEPVQFVSQSDFLMGP